MFTSLLLLLVSVTASASAALLAPLSGLDAPGVRPHEFIVGLKPGAQGLSQHTAGVTVLDSFHIHTWRALMVLAEGATALQSLREDPSVEYVEANSYNVHGAEERLLSRKTDPMSGVLRAVLEVEGVDMPELLCSSQESTNYVWGLTRTSSRALPDYNNGMYHYTEDGSDVDIYVVDSGIYLQHSDFGVRARHGFTANDVSPEGDEDLHGHGTHVAGTTAGETFGVAKGANVIAVKVLGGNNQGTIRDFIQGVEWAVNDHREKPGDKSVINMSLGAFNPSTSLDNAVAAAVAAGVTVAVAAMNNNRDACGDSPARVRTAVTVAASNNNDGLPNFTNYGECVDIVAPGNSVRSAYIGNPTATAVFSGTSMAAPHVAGAVARYLSTMESPPAPADIMDWLVETSTRGMLNINPPKHDTPNVLLYAACD